MPLHRFSPSRRTLLKHSGAVAASGFTGVLGALASRQALAAGRQLAPVASPYGDVAPVNDLVTGLPLLQLPAGFSYKSFGWTGDPMADGRSTPSHHDGMAVVATRRIGRSVEHVLVRNHERALDATVAAGIDAPHRYATGLVNGFVTITGATTVRVGTTTVTNPAAPNPAPLVGYPGGGTTNLVFRDGAWTSAFGSLGGTLGNCAGGPTPWGTWLTCEETIFDFSGIGGRRHGYVFEVDVDPLESDATPLVGLGRFVHEAAAVDPVSGHVYMTEDNRNLSALFRFVPEEGATGPDSLRAGGRLQAARVKSVVRKAVAASLAQVNDTGLLNPEIGDEYELEWVDLPDPDAAPRVVAGQPGGVSLGIMAGPTHAALSQGCARMSRGEGLWHAGGTLFIVDTAAGVDAGGRPGRGEGAVWALSLSTMRLKALFASGGQSAGNNPDNVVVSPRGGVVLCEDGGFGDGGSRLLGLTTAGASYVFCRNNVNLSASQIANAGKTVAAGDFRGIEFCGACFDPAGRVLFVNIQTPGITFAISGPWARGNL